MTLFGPCPLDGVDVSTLEPGAIVKIHYWLSQTIIARVLEVEPHSRYGPQRGWVEVEQITDFEDRDVKPVFLAAVEYMELVNN